MCSIYFTKYWWGYEYTHIRSVQICLCVKYMYIYIYTYLYLSLHIQIYLYISIFIYIFRLWHGMFDYASTLRIILFCFLMIFIVIQCVTRHFVFFLNFIVQYYIASHRSWIILRLYMVYSSTLRSTSMLVCCFSLLMHVSYYEIMFYWSKLLYWIMLHCILYVI